MYTFLVGYYVTENETAGPSKDNENDVIILAEARGPGQRIQRPVRHTLCEFALINVFSYSTDCF